MPAPGDCLCLNYFQEYVYLFKLVNSAFQRLVKRNGKVQNTFVSEYLQLVIYLCNTLIEEYRFSLKVLTP
jgi:hypothetical protein